MMQITYDAGGLHLITGTCTAIEVDDAERERMNYGETEKYGYYTIHDDNCIGYCITLNLPLKHCGSSESVSRSQRPSDYLR